ncbi:unnamed protein product [Lactuca virosa]|uniref:ZF-HD dimerization-type domain-containing protein n=1 Tax=Lactuca virosa TaxID=75947 RepID=A0AAU9NP21_9ASTR|nr:unnamed protein product [Lactuca virosa]
MHELAERVGWKMHKRDEDLIIRFCNEIGVDKGVFKVWMHNNKMAFDVKKDSGNHNNDNGSPGGGIDFLTNRNNHHEQSKCLPSYVCRFLSRFQGDKQFIGDRFGFWFVDY